MTEHYSYKIQNIIQKELFQAKKSIKIAVAWFTNDLLFQPLLLKLQSGVSVELILNRDEINDSDENDIDFTAFLNVGGILHWNMSKTLMHEKFCIIDDTTVIYGSYNWTNKAEYNDESVAVSKDEKSTLDFYTKLFDKLSKSYPAEKYVGARPFNVYDPFSIEKAEIVSDLCGAIVYRWIINEKYVYRIFSQSTGKQACLYNFDDVIINTAPRVVVIGVKRLGMWAFYSIEKKEIGISRYDKIELFGDDKPYFWIYTKDGIGVADKNGNEIIDCKYNNLTVYRESYTIVNKNGLYGILIWADERYQELKPCIFKEVTIIDKKRFKVKDQNEKWGIISNTGIDIIKMAYDEIEPIEDDYYLVRQGKYYGVDSPLCIKIKCIYDSITYRGKYYQNQFIVKSKEKYGLYADEKLRIPCEYDDLNPNDVSIKSGKAGVVTEKGEIEIPFKYSKIIKPCYRDAPYNQAFYLVYKKPHFGIWINGTEIGKVSDAKYLLNKYIPEFSLFEKNKDALLEELRHAIVRTIYEDVVHPEKVYDEKIIPASTRCKYGDKKIQFVRTPETTKKIERLTRKVYITDESFQGHRYTRRHYKYTQVLHDRRREVSKRFDREVPLDKIECQEFDCRHQLYKEGDIIVIPKDAPIVIDRRKEGGFIVIQTDAPIVIDQPVESEGRYVIVKIYNDSSDSFYYSTFNPWVLIKTEHCFKKVGDKYVRERVRPEGSACELCKDIKDIDEIFGILTHKRTKDCKLRISNVRSDLLMKDFKNGEYHTAYIYSYDIYE